MTTKKELFEKYVIQKANGEPIDPEAKYFVLRYDHNSKDQHARTVLNIYARSTGNVKLTEDILDEQQKWLNKDEE